MAVAIAPTGTGIEGDITRLAEQLAVVAAGFDPALVDGASAERLVGLLDRVERVAAGMKARAAARAAEAGAWRRAGYRSAEEWLGTSTGVPRSRAAELLAVGETLTTAPPVLVDAVAAGDLSAPQAAEIGRAAEHAPNAQASSSTSPAAPPSPASPSHAAASPPPAQTTPTSSGEPSNGGRGGNAAAPTGRQ